VSTGSKANTHDMDADAFEIRLTGRGAIKFSASVEHAKQRGDRAYIGRKPSYTRDQFNKVRDMLRQEAVSITQIARETGLTRQTVYRIKGDPAGAEGALVAWGL